MWNKEKHIEYRRLKKIGYTYSQLKEHFGDDIYDSNIYNKSSSLFSFLSYINEIKITPANVEYTLDITNSSYYKHGMDYTIQFKSNNISYVIILMFFEVNSIPTHNILFTTEEQYIKYKELFDRFIKNGFLSKKQHTQLKEIFERETNYFDLYNVMRYIAYIILDIYPTLPKNTILSIGDTDLKVKINLYRSIIKHTFVDIAEEEVFDLNNNKYYLYKNISI